MTHRRLLYFYPPKKVCSENVYSPPDLLPAPWLQPPFFSIKGLGPKQNHYLPDPLGYTRTHAHTHTQDAHAALHGALPRHDDEWEETACRSSSKDGAMAGQMPTTSECNMFFFLFLKPSG